ncbi:hypothetical protein AYI68_g2503 [Smittium mucronatum]|uniref:Uncharacterized protein n=1 Tax=Smittium mucronatum TaxID=133383 RepID=A0A1R0H2M2_9FUNG|nr:hypothetical protein AYI68_g2503 [Smittium mucronatum]
MSKFRMNSTRRQNNLPIKKSDIKIFRQNPAVPNNIINPEAGTGTHTDLILLRLNSYSGIILEYIDFFSRMAAAEHDLSLIYARMSEAFSLPSPDSSFSLANCPYHSLLPPSKNGLIDIRNQLLEYQQHGLVAPHNEFAIFLSSTILPSLNDLYNSNSKIIETYKIEIGSFSGRLVSIHAQLVKECSQLVRIHESVSKNLVYSKSDVDPFLQAQKIKYLQQEMYSVRSKLTRVSYHQKNIVQTHEINLIIKLKSIMRSFYDRQVSLSSSYLNNANAGLKNLDQVNELSEVSHFTKKFSRILGDEFESPHLPNNLKRLYNKSTSAISESVFASRNSSDILYSQCKSSLPLSSNLKDSESPNSVLQKKTFISKKSSSRNSISYGFPMPNNGPPEKKIYLKSSFTHSNQSSKNITNSPKNTNSKNSEKSHRYSQSINDSSIYANSYGQVDNSKLSYNFGVFDNRDLNDNFGLFESNKLNGNFGLVDISKLGNSFRLVDNYKISFHGIMTLLEREYFIKKVKTEAFVVLTNSGYVHVYLTHKRTPKSTDVESISIEETNSVPRNGEFSPEFENADPTHAKRTEMDTDEDVANDTATDVHESVEGNSYGSSGIMAMVPRVSSVATSVTGSRDTGSPSNCKSRENCIVPDIDHIDEGFNSIANDSIPSLGKSINTQYTTTVPIDSSANATLVTSSSSENLSTESGTDKELLKQYDLSAPMYSFFLLKTSVNTVGADGEQ